MSLRVNLETGFVELPEHIIDKHGTNLTGMLLETGVGYEDHQATLDLNPLLQNDPLCSPLQPCVLSTPLGTGDIEPF